MEGEVGSSPSNIRGTVHSGGMIRGRVGAGNCITGQITLPVADKEITLQTQIVTPTEQEQTITADSGFDGLKSVIVQPIPSNYGKITFNGVYLLVE